MTTHTVHATIEVEITNASALNALAALSGTVGGDERSKVEAAVKTGLKELPLVAKRYGFRIVDSSVTVD